jgi:hypothetical protein
VFYPVTVSTQQHTPFNLCDHVGFGRAVGDHPADSVDLLVGVRMVKLEPARLRLATPSTVVVVTVRGGPRL